MDQLNAGVVAGSRHRVGSRRPAIAAAAVSLALGFLPALLAGLLLPWPRAARGGTLLAGATSTGSTLAPLDVEALRQRYGQEALFRLRLGVEAARDDGRSCAPSAQGWIGSPQQQQLEAELAAGRPYRAGQLLGAWQQHEQRCSSSQPGA